MHHQHVGKQRRGDRDRTISHFVSPNGRVLSRKVCLFAEAIHSLERGQFYVGEQKSNS